MNIPIWDEKMKAKKYSDGGNERKGQFGRAAAERNGDTRNIYLRGGCKICVKSGFNN